jgi:hypothetical protein
MVSRDTSFVSVFSRVTQKSRINNWQSRYWGWIRLWRRERYAFRGNMRQEDKETWLDLGKEYIAREEEIYRESETGLPDKQAVSVSWRGV